MDLRIERQSRGIVHAVPRPAGGQPPASRPATADPGSQPTQLFDANSDGVIENWSIAHGGDSFANFDPPPSATVAAGSSDAKSHRGTDAVAVPVHGADHPAPPATAAAVHHAHAAYQRDGLGSRPPARPAPAARPAPVASTSPSR